MTDKELNLLRFPIGKYNPLFEVTEELLNEWIQTIEQLPFNLRDLVSDFSEEQLAKQEGWV